MRPAHVIEIVTPKKYILNGLRFGPEKARRVIIFVHGLTGSAFSMSRVVDSLIDPATAVLTFNNRGFEQIGSVKHLRGKKTEHVLAGAAHEVFTDCVDDIQGAVNSARRMGAKEIYLAGHSTGAQKTIYWASKGGRGVIGIILLGPLSDYSGALAERGLAALKKSASHAQKLISVGRAHELMPKQMREWFECDAQRFLSLYTPDSPEEIFTYARPEITPRTFSEVKIPALVLLAGADEYGDMPPKKISEWFMKWLYTGHVTIIPKVKHSFKGGEKDVATAIRDFVNTL